MLNSIIMLFCLCTLIIQRFNQLGSSFNQVISQQSMTRFPRFNKPLKALIIRGNLPRFKCWGSTFQVHPTIHRVQIPLQATSSTKFSSFEYLGQSMLSSWWDLSSFSGYFLEIREIEGHLFQNLNGGANHCKARSKGVVLKWFIKAKHLLKSFNQGHNTK